MARQILPVVWTAGNIDDLKRSLKESATGTDLGVQACTTLDDATRAAWGVFYASILEYARTPTSFWTTGTGRRPRGEEAGRSLHLAAEDRRGGCNAGAPAVNPQPQEPPGLTGISSIVKWVALALIVGAAAYATHEVVGVARELLPGRESDAERAEREEREETLVKSRIVMKRNRERMERERRAPGAGDKRRSRARGKRR